MHNKQADKPGPTAPATPSNYYAKTATISQFDYEIGDIVSMVMNDNGTNIIFVDEIISTRYSGFVARDFK